MGKLILSTLGGLLALSGIGVGQPVAIERDDYFKAIGVADRAIEKLERRKTVRIDQKAGTGNNEDGTATRSVDEIHEFSLPNSTRQVQTEVYDGRKSVREYIEIGSIRYCREGNQKWRKTLDFCGITSLRGYVSESVDKFSMEKSGKGETLYLMESTYGPEGRKELEVRKIWVDNLGRITKEESRSRAVGAAKDDYIRTATYEYPPVSPKIKIAAPIH